MEGLGFLPDGARGDETIPPLLGDNLIAIDIFEQGHTLDNDEEIDERSIDGGLFGTG